MGNYKTEGSTNGLRLQEIQEIQEIQALRLQSLPPLVIPMIPLIIAAVILGLTAVQSGYNIYKTNESTKISDDYNKLMSGFYGSSLSENSAYWARYIRAHHLENRRVLYPYRTGAQMSPAAYLSSINALDLNALARQSAYVNGAVNTGKSAAYGYAAAKVAGGKEPLYPNQTTQSPRTTLIDTGWKYGY